MKNVHKIISGLAISMTVFSAVVGMEEIDNKEAFKVCVPLARQIHDRVEKILMNFKDSMNAYYQRTGNPKRITTGESEPIRLPSTKAIFPEPPALPEEFNKNAASTSLTVESMYDSSQNMYYDSNILGSVGIGGFITPFTTSGANLPQPETLDGKKPLETNQLETLKLQDYSEDAGPLTKTLTTSAFEETDNPSSGLKLSQTTIIEDPEQTGRIVISIKGTTESNPLMLSFVDMAAVANLQETNEGSTQGTPTKIHTPSLNNGGGVGGLGNPGAEGAPPSANSDESKPSQGDDKSPRGGGWWPFSGGWFS